MNQTNVGSIKVVCGEVIPTEELKIEMPSKNAKVNEINVNIIDFKDIKVEEAKSSGNRIITKSGNLTNFNNDDLKTIEEAREVRRQRKGLLKAKNTDIGR